MGRVVGLVESHRDAITLDGAEITLSDERWQSCTRYYSNLRNWRATDGKWAIASRDVSSLEMRCAGMS